MPKYMGGLGFRDTELFNLAMLAKQGWRIFQEPDALSARILKVVYFPTVDVLQSELGSHPSQVWRAVHAGLSVLKQGLIRRIGNGETTEIWNMNWIPRDNLLRTLFPVSVNPPSLVSELIDGPLRSWNLDAINTHLCPMDAQAVLNIPLSTASCDDSWAWHYERSGNFTVRSAYRMLVDTKRRREDWLEGRSCSSDTRMARNQWTKLWSAKVPAKVRSFAWRLAKNSIPTGETLKRRHMSEADTCVICNAAADSWRHALLDCHMSKCIWALMEEELVEHVIDPY